ncbi:MAG TPA: enoyl-CoA hydratase/isomerase family protein [Desulfobacteraceae bacterium]|nr:enoyl-CoA hydratase/isomerase family protein [Desulfobacteraceae bacterium]
MGNSDNRSVIEEKIELKKESQYLGLITFNRPKEMNPLNWDTVLLLRDILKSLAEDSEIRVIALTGKGKAFSAGGDLKAYQKLQRDEIGFRDFLEDFHSTCALIEDIRKPVIALINGFSAAGGTELLLSCDFAYAGESARIGDGHINFGQMGGGGVLGRICRRIHPAHAREILFTGKLLTAQGAMDWGLVNRVVPDGKLIDAALEFANEVSKKSPLALANMKTVVNKALRMREEDALLLERSVCHHYCLTSHDAPEGLTAFAKKREANYRGE